MKKMLSLGLACLLIFTLAACGGGKAAPTSAPSEAPAVTAAPVVTPAPSAAPGETPAATPGLGGGCGEGVSWSFEGETLTISGKGAMDDYTLLTTPWDSASVSLLVTKLVVEEGVTAIGEYAFASCCNLAEVSLPQSLNTLCGFAFADCMALQNITLPENLLYIGNSVFSGSGLVSVVLPVKLAALGDMAFALCGALTDVTLPQTLLVLGEDVFAGCDVLAELRCYDNTTASALLGGEGYGRFVTSAGQGAALDPTWSGTIQGLDWVLSNDGGWTLRLSGSGAMPDFTVQGGRAAPWSPLGTLVEKIEIDDGFTSVGSYAFWGCSSVTELTLPAGLTKLGDYSFGVCSALATLTVPEGVTAIGRGAFSACTSLTTILLPESLQTIGEEAFQMCTSLRELYIPAAVREIGTGALEFGNDGATAIITESGSYAESFVKNNG